MKKVKKMAFGGGANLPVQAQAAAANPANTGVDRAMPANSNMGGAMRGQERAAEMSGRAMPNIPAPVPEVAPVADPGLARAAAMSGRTMPVPGVGMRPQGMKKGGAVKSSASRRADGIAQRGKTKGKMV